MTHDEAKEAWRKQEEVKYQGVWYTISALIYRLPRSLTVELYDKCGHCVVIASPDKVEKGAKEKDG